jgi:iron complex outermembrane recepter protein
MLIIVSTDVNKKYEVVNMSLPLSLTNKGVRLLPKSILATSVLNVLLASAAFAQSGNALLEEVLVTAQKKSAAQAVQDVPIAISAYSGRKIEAMFAVDLTDIGFTAPNVQLTPQGTVPGTANFSIRGWGTTGQSIPSSDPAVGVVQDGVAFGTIYGVVTDVFDMESLEVLRGPQGTLFGRNVSAGAVVMKTTRPDHDDTTAKLLVGTGSFALRETKVLLSGPMSDDVAGKVAVLWRDQDGMWDNTATGGEQGARQSLVIRPAVSYRGGSGTYTAIAEYGDVKADGMSGRNFLCVAASVVSNCDPFEPNLDPYDEATTRQTTKGQSNIDWFGLTLEGVWDLWDGTLTGVLGYRQLEQSMWGDIDGAPNTIRFQFGPGTGFDQEQQSFELRWAGNLSDRLDLTTGVNVFQQDYTYDERRLLIDALDLRASSNIDHMTAGVFAQADYMLTDDLTLTVGGRWSYEEKDAAIGVIGDPTGFGNCRRFTGALLGGSDVISETSPASLSDCKPAYLDKQDWSNFTPKLGLTWMMSDDTMTYASYTRGFRSGGYNVRFSDISLVTRPDNPGSTPGPYDEEIVDALELGLKTEFMEGRARFNAAIFQNSYDDMQLSANNQSGVQSIFNAATATMQGFELEGVWAVTDNLTLEGTYGYVDASYDDADFLVQTFGPDTDVGDFLLQMVSEQTWFVAATYDHEVGREGSLSWRASYNYADDAAADNFNFLLLNDYSLVDASVTYKSADERLRIALYGKNLTDEVYFNFGFDNTSIGSKTMWLSPPRTWGVQVSYDF